MRYIAALFAALIAIASARADVVKLPVLGGAGGEHFEYRCANDGYLVGLRAYVGLWIDNVQAVCAKYDPVTGRMSQRAPEGPVFGGASGRTNTSDWSGNRFPCVRDQLVFGFGVAETKNQPVLGRIYLGCLFSTTLKRPAGAEIQNSIDIMSGDGLKDVRAAACPDGLVAVGIRGRSGVYLDAFGLICGPAGRASSRKEPLTVALISADGSKVTYSDPTIRATNGELVLLDWCREWGANCGRPTAEFYCKARGYPFVKAFAHTGPGQRTGIVTTGEICTLERCTGFREISCSKSDVLEAEPSQGPSPFGAAERPRNPDTGIVVNQPGAAVWIPRNPDRDIVADRPGVAAIVTGQQPHAQPHTVPVPTADARNKFTGAWATVTSGRHYDMSLTQDRRTVNGTYVSQDGSIKGTIDGRIKGGVLEYRWTEGTSTGSGTFTLAPDGNSFAGWWNSSDDPNVAQSSWSGTRK